MSLQFLNQSSGNAFAPSVTYDQDGCQAGRNAVDTSPGGWADACAAGVTGDWVIRAVVDCAPAPAVPTLEWPAGVLALLVALAATGWAALRVRRGFDCKRPT